MFLSSCRKLAAKYFHHITEMEPFPVFVKGIGLRVLYQPNCGYDGKKRVFTECDLICFKKNKMDFFLYLNSNWFEGTEWQIFQGPGLLKNFHVKSMLINKDFQTCHLVGWLHSRKPSRSHVRKSFLLTWNLTWILLCSCQPRKILFLFKITPPHTLPGELRNC